MDCIAGGGLVRLALACGVAGAPLQALLKNTHGGAGVVAALEGCVFVGNTKSSLGDA
jgi:hypothetical protein